MTSDHFRGERAEPEEAGGLGAAMPGSGTADETGERTTGASGVDGPSGGAAYGDVDRATAGSLDETPDETS